MFKRSNSTNPTKVTSRINYRVNKFQSSDNIGQSRIEALNSRNQITALFQEFNFYKHQATKEKLELIRQKFNLENEIINKSKTTELLIKQIKDIERDIISIEQEVRKLTSEKLSLLDEYKNDGGEIRKREVQEKLIANEIICIREAEDKASPIEKEQLRKLKTENKLLEENYKGLSDQLTKLKEYCERREIKLNLATKIKSMQNKI